MKFKINIHEQAEIELWQAVNWYELQAEGIGVDFIDGVVLLAHGFPVSSTSTFRQAQCRLSREEPWVYKENLFFEG